MKDTTDELNERRFREFFRHAMNDTFNTDANLTTNLCFSVESLAKIDPVEEKVSGNHISQGIKTQAIRPQRLRQKVFDPPKHADS